MLDAEERREYKRQWDREHRPSGHARDKTAKSGEKASPTQSDKSDKTDAIAEAEAEAEAIEEEIKEEETSSSSRPPHQETKSHKATRAEVVISAWQKLPLPADLKAVTAPGVLAVEQELAAMDLDPAQPVHESDVLAAIENYGRALSLTDSQSGKHKLLTWLRVHIRRTYLPDVFNIENHNRRNFQQKGKVQTDTKTEYERMKAKGDL